MSIAIDMLLFMIGLFVLWLLQSLLTSHDSKFRLNFKDIIIQSTVEIKNTIEIPIHHFASNTMNSIIMGLIITYHLNRYIECIVSKGLYCFLPYF